MKAMILAAGRGERMLPLTAHTPKSLLTVANKPLIVYHLENLAAAGFTDIVINVSYLGEQIITALGDGSRWNMHINYIVEKKPLEVAGGIINALHLLSDTSFITINADIWTDYPLANLKNTPVEYAHLVLTTTPDYYPQGDFSLADNRLIPALPHQGLIAMGITLYHPQFFAGMTPGIKPMGILWHQAVTRGELTGEHYQGKWFDVGTPERLNKVNQLLCG